MRDQVEGARMLRRRPDPPAGKVCLTTTLLAQSGYHGQASLLGGVDATSSPPGLLRLWLHPATEILAHLAVPRDHRSSSSSTDAMERVTAEVERRAKVVEIFPNSDSLLRLATAVL